MKKKKIYIIVICILLIGILVGGYCTYYFHNKANVNKAENINDKMSDKDSKKQNDINKEESTKDEDNRDVAPSNDATNTTFNSNQKNNTKSTNNNQNTNNTNSNSKNNSVQSENNVQSPANQNKSESPWDALGISEYDYYHKPINKDVTNYYTTLAECEEAGSKLDHYICMQVNSYSGDIVGYTIVQ